MSSRRKIFQIKSDFSAISLKPLSHENYTNGCILPEPSVTMATCWDFKPLSADNSTLFIQRVFRSLGLYRNPKPNLKQAAVARSPFNRKKP